MQGDVQLSVEHRQELSAFLAHLSTVGGDPEDGICGHIMDHFKTGSAIAYWFDYHDFNLFKLWPKCSGKLTFPVPSETEEGAAQRYIQCKAMWEGEYGASRKELAAFLSELVLTYGE